MNETILGVALVISLLANAVLVFLWNDALYSMRLYRQIFRDGFTSKPEPVTQPQSPSQMAP